MGFLLRIKGVEDDENENIQQFEISNNEIESDGSEDVTNKVIEKVNGSETSYRVPWKLMKSVRTTKDAELNWLVEMPKHIEADHERKKLELAEEHKRNKAEPEDMRKEIEDQRDKLVEDAVEKLLT
ncbi:hypothetical protein Tco_0582030 [Tanacetum coccineum]